MLAEDFDKYLKEGQSFFFFIFHLLMMIIPVFFYGFAIILLFRHRNATLKTISGSQNNVEARLIIPCVFNSIVFIIGQVVITIGTGEGKWATWTVMLLFSSNSAVNPVLLIMFSAIIRRKIFELLGFEFLDGRKYTTVPRATCSPSPPLRKEETTFNSESSSMIVQSSQVY